MVAAAAVLVDRSLLAGAAAIVALAVTQIVWSRQPPVSAKVLGLGQLGLGAAIVAVTAVGVLA